MAQDNFSFVSLNNPFLRRKFISYEDDETIPVYIDPAEESSSPQFTSEFMPSAIPASELSHSPLFNQEKSEIKPTESMLNLEAAIGSSLALAIDQLELNCHSNPCSDLSQQSDPKIFCPSSEISEVFLEEESRGIVITNVYSIPKNLLISQIEKYGRVLYILTEFKQTKGLVFVAYSDIRCAAKAFKELTFAFQPAENELNCAIQIHFCPVLNIYGTQSSRLLLQNYPYNFQDSTILTLMSKFGEVQRFSRQFMNTKYGADCFIIDFFDIDSAKRALLELQNAPGFNLIVQLIESGARESKNENLTKLVRTWQMNTPAHPGDNERMRWNASTVPPAPCKCCSNAHVPPAQADLNRFQSNSVLTDNVFTTSSVPIHHPVSNSDNCFQYVEIIGVPNGADSNFVKVPGVHIQSVTTEKVGLRPQTSDKFIRTLSPNHTQSVSSHSQPASYKPQVSKHDRPREQTPVGSDAEFSLNVDKIISGNDKRTTVMIRNIPNKYTQQMLLSEINVNFKGTYDFFYLPIDFKNRCNVGYAFINFINHLSIPLFYDRFNGQKWKTFNSEKVCAISYARIQGKASMISRFQNSSLLEKEGQYRPLLFFSGGDQVGKAEPFPISRKGAKLIPSS